MQLPGACLTDNDLLRFHAGELDGDAAARFGEHLKECQICDGRSSEMLSAHDDLLNRVRGIRNLLQHIGPSPKATRESTCDVVSQRASRFPEDTHTGRSIGAYHLGRKLGEGGFGVVYLAEQEKPLRRRVALKLLKPGMDSRQIVSRFEAERQALALMEHPCVARVFDAGTTESGRPFFVMEYVDGVPITNFCTQKRLDYHDRLELFLQVCDAVQHAHQKGIIHRDLKASNILVAVDAARPLPKVIDFGIAKAIEKPLTDSTLQTLEGVFVGTPEYMSPEQAGQGPAVDTRTDIYSLGVVLYELLTDQLPFDSRQLRQLGHSEMLRMIREDDPPRPSARCLADGSWSRTSKSGVSLGDHPDTSLRRRQLEGELDWITMKAIEKDPARRYQSASEFAADIRRYLNHEVVLACPPSTSYRLRKFVRRHRAGVVACAAAFGALVLGMIGTAGMAYVAGQEKRDAIAAREEAENARLVEAAQRQLVEKREAEARQVSQFQSRILEQVVPMELGLHLREEMISKLEAAFDRTGLDEARRSQRLEQFQRELGQIDFTGAASDMLDHAILKPTIAAIDQEFENQPLVAADLRETLALIYEKLGRHDVALSLQEQALSVRRQLLETGDSRVIRAMNNVAILLSANQRHGEAESLICEALERSRSRGAEAPETLRSMANLGTILDAQGKYGEARQHLEQCLEIRRRVLGETHVDTLIAASNLAAVHQGMGEYAEAETLYREVLEKRRRVLGETHHDTLKSISNFGYFLKQRGRLTEAEPYYREALELMSRVLGDTHLNTMTAMNNLGALLGEQNKLDEAEYYYRTVLERRRKLLSDHHPHTLASINNMGFFLFRKGRRDEAIVLFRESRDKLRANYGSENLLTLTAMENVALALMMERRWEEAEPDFREALELRRKVSGRTHPATITTQKNLATVLTSRQQFAEAESLLSTVLDDDEQSNSLSTEQRAALIERRIALYEAWHESDPNAGHDAKAERWRRELKPAETKYPNDDE